MTFQLPKLQSPFPQLSCKNLHVPVKTHDPLFRSVKTPFPVFSKQSPADASEPTKRDSIFKHAFPSRVSPRRPGTARLPGVNPPGRRRTVSDGSLLAPLRCAPLSADRASGQTFAPFSARPLASPGCPSYGKLRRRRPREQALRRSSLQLGITSPLVLAVFRVRPHPHPKSEVKLANTSRFPKQKDRKCFPLSLGARRGCVRGTPGLRGVPPTSRARAAPLEGLPATQTPKQPRPRGPPPGGRRRPAGGPGRCPSGARGPARPGSSPGGPQSSGPSRTPGRGGACGRPHTPPGRGPHSPAGPARPPREPGLGAASVRPARASPLRAPGPRGRDLPPSPLAAGPGERGGRGPGAGAATHLRPAAARGG